MSRKSAWVEVSLERTLPLRAVAMASLSSFLGKATSILWRGDREERGAVCVCAVTQWKEQALQLFH